MKTKTNKHPAIILAIMSIFILGLFCGCGGSDTSDEDAAKAGTKAVATDTVDQGGDEAAEETTKAPKTGTEDPAIDTVLAAAYEDIEGFDGKWKNIAVDVGDTITTIDFDWNGDHYQYQFDQGKNEIVK